MSDDMAEEMEEVIERAELVMSKDSDEQGFTSAEMREWLGKLD